MSDLCLYRDQKKDFMVLGEPTVPTTIKSVAFQVDTDIEHANNDQPCGGCPYRGERLRLTDDDSMTELGSSSGAKSQDGELFPALHPVVFGCLKQKTLPRIWCLRIVANPWLERLSMFAILVNCVTLGLYEPCSHNHSEECTNDVCRALSVCDHVVLSFFTIEMLIKMLAMGVWGKIGYLGDAWNFLDFFIVVMGLIENILPSNSYVNLSALRTVRVLRPLRAINRIPSLRILVMLLMDTLPMLGNVLMLCSFVFFIFGILAVQLWSSVLRQRCTLSTEMTNWLNNTNGLVFEKLLNEVPNGGASVCSLDKGNGDFHCNDRSILTYYRVENITCKLDRSHYQLGASKDHIYRYNNTNHCIDWYQYYSNCSTSGENPFQKSINFDNIMYAWVAIFQVISLEGWVEIMYLLMDGFSFYCFIYFILLIVIGSFFMINLCLVVIATQFSETKQREERLMEDQRMRFKSNDSTLASFSPPGNCYEETLKYISHVFRKTRRRWLRRLKRWRKKRLPADAVNFKSDESTFDTDEPVEALRNRHNAYRRRHKKLYRLDCFKSKSNSDQQSIHLHHHFHHHHHHYHIQGGRRSSVELQSNCGSTANSCGKNSSDRLLKVGVEIDLHERPTGISLLPTRLMLSNGHDETAVSYSGLRKSIQLSIPTLSTGSSLCSINRKPDDRRASNTSSSTDIALTSAGVLRFKPCAVRHSSKFSGKSKTCSSNNTVPDCYPDDATFHGLQFPYMPSSKCNFSESKLGQCPQKIRFENVSNSFVEINCGNTVPSKKLIQNHRYRPLLSQCSVVHLFFKKRKDRIKSAWKCISRKARLIVDSSYFNRFIMIAITINTMSMGIEFHNQPNYLTRILEYSNIVFTTIFVLEMFTKIVAYGIFQYIFNIFNVLDAFIVIISVIEIACSNGLGGFSVLRTFRLLRVFKLVRFLPALQRQVVVLIKTMDNVVTFMMLLLLFIFIYSILGMHLFGCKFCWKKEDGSGETECDRKNFDSLLWAFVTVFQILTQEDWNVVLYNGMASTSPWASIYFISLVAVGNFVLFNLLVAILVEGFQTESRSSSTIPSDDDSDIIKAVLRTTRRPSHITYQSVRVTSESDSDPPSSTPSSYAAADDSVEDVSSSEEEQLKGVDNKEGLGLQAKLLAPSIDCDENDENMNFNEKWKKSPVLPVITHTSATPVGTPTPLGSTPRINLLRRRDEGEVFVFGYSRSSSGCDETTENKAYSQQELSFIDSNSQTTDKSKTNLSCRSSISPRWHTRSSQDATHLAKERLVNQESSFQQIKWKNSLHNKTGDLYFDGEDSASDLNISIPLPDDKICSSLKLDEDWKEKSWRKISSESSFESNMTTHEDKESLNENLFQRFIRKQLCPFIEKRKEWPLFVLRPDNRFRSFLGRIVRKKQFDYFILAFIMANCITITFEKPSLNENAEEYDLLKFLDYLFTTVFTIELALKVLANGFYIGSNAYLSSGWNILDCLLVATSLIDVLVNVILQAEQVDFLGVLRVFRLLRALRPLRVINRAPGLKLVVRTLLSSLKPIGNIVLICCAFFVIFGILGVQLLKGKFGYCIGPKHVLNKTECDNEDQQWSTRQYNFDDLFQALMALFVLASKDGWVEIMYNAIDATGVDQEPKRNHNLWMLIYIISFILIVGFFVINMFVGVVVENFHRCREEHEQEEIRRREARRLHKLERQERKRAAQLNQSENESFSRKTLKLALSSFDSVRTKCRRVCRLVRNLYQRCYKDEPKYYMRYSCLRRKMYNLCVSKHFELTISCVIGLNILTMAAEHYQQPAALGEALRIANFIFTVVFVLEAVVKIISFGVLRYFREKWNILDMLIVISSVVGILIEEYTGDGFEIQPSIIRVMRVLRVARVLKLMKISNGIRSLLETVARAIPQVGNLGMLFLLLFFIFAALGVELFGKITCDEEDFPCEALGRHASFKNFGIALLTLFRISTGDNWNGILKDTLRCHPNKDCWLTRILSPLYFIVFVMMAQFVMVNVVVAVLMKQLEESRCDASEDGYEEDDESSSQNDDEDSYNDVINKNKYFSDDTRASENKSEQQSEDFAVVELREIDIMLTSADEIKEHSTGFQVKPTDLKKMKPKFKSMVNFFSYEDDTGLMESRDHEIVQDQENKFDQKKTLSLPCLKLKFPVSSKEKAKELAEEEVIRSNSYTFDDEKSLSKNYQNDDFYNKKELVNEIQTSFSSSGHSLSTSQSKSSSSLNLGFLFSINETSSFEDLDKDSLHVSSTNSLPPCVLTQQSNSMGELYNHSTLSRANKHFKSEPTLQSYQQISGNKTDQINLDIDNQNNILE